MAETITVADVEAALKAAARTATGRKSRVTIVLGEGAKRDCAAAANAYVRNAFQDADMKRRELSYKTPKLIDFAGRLTAHVEALRELHTEWIAWRNRKDFLVTLGIDSDCYLGGDRDMALRLLRDYTIGLNDAASAAVGLVSCIEDRRPNDDDLGLGPSYLVAWTADEGGNIHVNEKPMKAFAQWVISTAGVWNAEGNKAAAEPSKKGPDNSPFVRFMSALQARMPADIPTPQDGRSFEGRVFHALTNPPNK